MTIKQYRNLSLTNLPEKTKELLLKAVTENPLPSPEDVVTEPVDAGFYVSVGELIDTRETEPFEQRPITVNNVLKIMAGITSKGGRVPGNVYPLSETHKVLCPIKVGYNDSGDLIGILGGRNRLTALLTYYTIQGVDIDSEEFRNALIRVIPERWDMRVVKADNTSRSMTKDENGSIKVQVQFPDVDVTDPEALIDAYYDKKLKLNESVALAALTFFEDEDYVKEYGENKPTTLTVYQTVSAVITQFKQNYKASFKLFSERDFALKFLSQVVQNLPVAVEEYFAEGGTTTAREYVRLAAILLPLVIDFDMEQYQSADERAKKTSPTKKIAKTAQAKIAASEKKPRKPRAKKAQAEVVADDVVTEEE